MRILVADDERDLNALIAQKLRKEHYSVDCCHDGEEALEYLRMADYDAVVLDIMMPKKDGISVLKELRQWVSCAGAAADGQGQHRRPCAGARRRGRRLSHQALCL